MPATAVLLRRQLDQRLDQLRAAAAIPPKGGWIRAIREALGMSKAQLGRRLNTQRQDILALEKREESGAVTLRTLREVADALDAELFYAIVPRNSLTQMMVSQAHRKALSELAQVAHLMRLEDQEVGKEETARQLKERTDELLRSRSRALWDTRQP